MTVYTFVINETNTVFYVRENEIMPTIPENAAIQSIIETRARTRAESPGRRC